jgi:hypothetical protein
MKPESAKGSKTKPGDIIAIVLRSDMIAVGIVLHISKRYRHGILVGYFDRCFSSMEEIDVNTLIPQFAFTPNYTSKRIVELGEWPIIGHSDVLLSKSSVPILVSVTTLFLKDEIVGQLSSVEETKAYEVLAGQGKEFVENRLRSHFEVTKESVRNCV